MHRLSNGTQVNVLPAPIAVTGTPGYAARPIPGGQAPSIIDPDDFNAHQEELCGVVESAGLTCDKTNNGQLLQALDMLFQPVASYTYDPSYKQTKTSGGVETTFYFRNVTVETDDTGYGVITLTYPFALTSVSAYAFVPDFEGAAGLPASLVANIPTGAGGAFTQQIVRLQLAGSGGAGSLCAISGIVVGN